MILHPQDAELLVARRDSGGGRSLVLSEGGTQAIYATLSLMKILVFGATGMLGKALMRRSTEDQVQGLGSDQADIRNPEQVEEVVRKAAPDRIVLSAAYTDFDGCELNPTFA